MHKCLDFATIGFRLCTDITVAGSPSPAPSEDDDEGCGTGTATSNHSSGHGGSHSSIKKGRQKRGVLPKQATSIMRTWLFEHLVVSITFQFYRITALSLSYTYTLLPCINENYIP